jgi:uncharacterized protein YdaU (DUF1376 family)
VNDEPVRDHTGVAYLAGILGSLLIVAALAWAIHRYTQPPPLGEDRAAVRAKALAEMRGADAEALSATGWMDQSKGIVRLRIEDSMALVEREWRNPSAARSNLIERVEKATALPPKAPEKPSQFE